MRAHGISGSHFTANYLPVDEVFARRIADAYEQLPIDDSGNSEVLAAYTAFVDEIQLQWDFAIQNGMHFEPWIDTEAADGSPTSGPYQTSIEMAEDVARGHLWFFTGGPHSHPLMSTPDAQGLTPNDKLRAIHDYYAHAGGGYGFGPRGEENAWRAHMQMFSPLAQRAMTTETRGQNSWVNFGKHNYGPLGEPLNLDPATKPYAVQKLALLPPEFSTLGDTTYFQRAKTPKREVPQGHDLNPVEFKDGALLVGTRYIDKGTANTPFQTALLTTGFQLFRDAPEKMAQAAKLFRSFTLIPKALKRTKSDEKLVRAGIDAMKENLRALWNNYPAEWRDRSTHWYIGANRIANELAAAYNVSTDQAAGVLAALSPQMDWFRNVSLAERVLALSQTLRDNNEEFTSEMAENFRETQALAVETWVRQKMKDKTEEQKLAYRQEKAAELAEVMTMVGKRWDAMNITERARLLRNFDELNNPRSYDVISPEGDRAGVVKNQPKTRILKREPKPEKLREGETVRPLEDGTFEVTAPPEDADVAWGAYVFIENALAIVADDSPATISANLGGEHKVRSFYNNISHPWDYRSVTMDTHAVAAAFLQPFSGSAVEVIATMNGSKPKGYPLTFPQEASTGMSGINGILAQAYFELGQEFGVRPSAVQSATWEAIRSLYQPEQKRGPQGEALAAQVKVALESYVRGETTHAEAFSAIVAASGGFHPPAWAGVPVSEQGALAVASVQPRGTGVSAGRRVARGDSPGLAGGSADNARRDGVVLGAVGSAATFNQRTRGAVTFRRGLPPVLRMFKASNRSTFFHETGHIFLEMMGSLTEQLEAKAAAGEPLDPQQQQFVDDYRLVVLPWLGVQSRADVGTPQHEQFARGFEAHLMSGAVPGTGLNAVFARVARWLKSLYRGLEGLSQEAGFEVPPLTAEVAAVMNRLLLTDQALADAESQLEVRPLFATAEEAKADPIEFEGYRAKITAAGEARREQLTRRLMSDIVREEAAEWKAEQAQVTAEVTAQVNEEPVYKAMEAMRRGQPSMKLSRKLLVAQFGEDYLKKLPRPYLYQVEGGQSPEVVADAFGFQSAEAMLQAIIAAKSKTDEIDQRVAAVMEERHGSVANDPEALKLEALKAVLNTQQDDVIKAELRMLRRLQRDAKPSVRAAIADAKAKGKTGAAALKATTLHEATTASWARARIGGMQMKDISPARYLAVSTRASQRAQEAAARGDFETAIAEKQSQLANLALYHEATRLRDSIEDARARYGEMFAADDRIAPRRDMAYVLAARQLVAHYFWPEKARENTAREKFDQLKDHEPDVHAALEPQITKVLALAPTLAKMTAEQFDQFREVVDGLWQLSRTSRQQVVDGEALDRESIVTRLTDRMYEMPSKPPRTEAQSTLLSWRAQATRVEHWITLMDGGPAGPFRTLIWNPVREATTAYRTAKVATLQRYLDLLTTVQATLTPGRIEAPELGFTFESRAALLHAVLHSGNESNLTKLLIGYGWGGLDEAANLDRSRWDKFFERATSDGTITKADMDFVQGVWDLLESLKSGAQVAHRDLYGRYFNEVTHAPVRTPFGLYRGGYVPAVLDPFASADGVARTDADALEGTHHTMFPVPGFTKDRVANYAQPLALDLRLLPQHMDKVLRFTHIMPTAKATQRVVHDRTFREAMHGIDPQAVSDLLEPWLQRAYNQRVSEPSTSRGGRGADRFFRALRTRTGLNMMAGHVINVLQQFTGLSTAFLVVKPKYLRNALWRYMREPLKMAERISEMDPFMKTRLQASAFEIQGHIDDLLAPTSKYERLDAFGKKHGYLLQAATQNIVDNIVWQAAYDQSVAEHGVGSVRAAGAAVRQTQGSFSPEDISSVEVQREFVRIFGMFYGYFNNMANLNVGQMQAVARDLGLKKGAGRALYIYTFGFAAPAILGEVIMRALGGGPDEDDDDSWLNGVMEVFFGSQLRAATAMVPFIGQALQASLNIYLTDEPYDDRISTSPAIRAIESAGRAPDSLYKAIVEQRDGAARRAVRDTLTAIGLLTGAPVGAIARPAGYAAEVLSGDTVPEGPVDVLQGAVSGR